MAFFGGLIKLVITIRKSFDGSGSGEMYAKIKWPFPCPKMVRNRGQDVSSDVNKATKMKIPVSTIISYWIFFGVMAATWALV
jgi:hypothetical protein